MRRSNLRYRGTVEGLIDTPFVVVAECGPDERVVGFVVTRGSGDWPVIVLAAASTTPSLYMVSSCYCHFVINNLYDKLHENSRVYHRILQVIENQYLLMDYGRKGPLY